MTRYGPFRPAAVVSVSFLALGLGGCGSNAPEIPPELVSTGGGFGSEPGDIVQNLCFQGWQSPMQAGSDPRRFETVCFYDFNDPLGTRKNELLLVNSAAIWCQACKVEHETLPGYYAELEPQGLEILSGLFQDASSNPATNDDLARWTTRYSITFPMVLDAEFQLGAYASAETAPLNLVIDARNMRILEKFIGDQAAVMWPFIRGELEARAR